MRQHFDRFKKRHVIAVHSGGRVSIYDQNKYCLVYSDGVLRIRLLVKSGSINRDGYVMVIGISRYDWKARFYSKSTGITIPDSYDGILILAILEMSDVFSYLVRDEAACLLEEYYADDRGVIF